MGLSEYLRHVFLNAAFRDTAYTSPTSVWIALFDGDPDNGGTEVSGTDYSRESASFNAPSGGKVTNSAKVDFGTAGTGGWGDITHAAVYDDNTAGNLLGSAALASAKNVSEGDAFEIPAGEIEIEIT